MLEEQLLKLFPLHMREKLKKADIDQSTLEEIRIRAGQPLMFLYGDGEYFLEENSDTLVDTHMDTA